MVNDPPTISAVIPNYNHGALIETSIASIAAQRPAPGEIIVVDDGSIDDSLARLRALEQRFPTLRVVALPRNVGAINALNSGLREARGTYVYFGAADDQTLPGLFAALLPLLEANPSIALASAEGLVADNETGRLEFRPPARPSDRPTVFDPKGIAALFECIDNWVLTGTALIRRERLLEAGGFDPELGAFADGYAVRHLAFRWGAAFAPHLGLVWRISSSGLSRSQAADADKTRKVMARALERLAADPAVPAWYPSLFERRWRFGIGRLALASAPVNTQVLRQVVARGSGDRCILALAAVTGKVGRLSALVWLTVRERPFSAVALLRTRWQRRAIRPENVLQSLGHATANGAEQPLR